MGAKILFGWRMRALVAGLMVSIACGMAAARASAATPPTYVGQWGSYGTTYDEPQGVATDGAGNVYVADTSNHRVEKFSATGTLLTEWGSRGTGDGQFVYPVGIAVDGTGNVYVADYWNQRVEKFSSSGTFLRKWGTAGSGDGQFDYPHAIAVDGAGDVYVADSGNNRVEEFDSSGNLLAKWGSFGSADGQFNYPSGIAVDSSGDVYVVDESNNRVQKFDSSGTFLAKWGSYGTGDGQFQYPDGIGVDGTGDVYVADQEGNRVEEFNSSGTFLAKWGSEGSGDGQFEFPLAVAVNSTGDVYVADTNNNRIEQFGSSGTFVRKWDTGLVDGQFDNPLGIAARGNDVYVADTYNNRMQKFSSSGTFVAAWGRQGSDNGQFSEPQGVAVNSAGDVYVADAANQRIQEFDSSGNFVTGWGSQGTGDGQFEEPFAVAVDSSGNVYVADPGFSRVEKFSSSGTFLAKWGTYGSGDGQFEADKSIAVDSAGDVYVADTYNSRVQEFSSTGTFIAKWGTYGTGDGQFNNPDGIAVDGAGNVYVADSGNNRVQEFDSSGTFLAKWGTHGSGDGAFSDPEAIAVNGAGDVYVLDTGNSRVEEFSAGTTPPSAPGSPSLSSGATPQEDGQLTVGWPASSTSGVTYTLEQEHSGGSWTQVASGLMDTSYSFGDGTNAAEGEGTWSFRVKAVDSNSQSSDWAEGDTLVVVDKSPPTPPTGGAGTPDWTDLNTGNAWYKDSATVSFSGSTDPTLADGSAGSGVDHYTGGQTFSATGMHTATGHAVDAAGNQSDGADYNVYVDADPPTVSFTNCPSYVQQGSTATATVTASDVGAGLANDPSGDVPLDTSTLGSQSKKVTATDHVGHSTDATCAYTVDAGPTDPGTPTSSSSLNRDGAFTLSWNTATDGDGDSITYTLQHKDSSSGASWSDVASGLTGTSYSFGSGGNAAEGEGTWTYRVVASDGHFSTTGGESSSVKVDKSAPSAPTLAADAGSGQSASYTDGSGTTWYKDSELVNVKDNGDPALQDTSAGSGVDSSSFPASFSVTTDGTSTASKTVGDQAGNTSAAGTLTAHVDTKAPTVTITDCPTAPVPAGSSMSVHWTASDNEAGVAGPTSGTVPLVTNSIGMKVANAPQATDNVGHKSANPGASCNYTVAYNPNGFYKPTTGFNSVNAGSSIPLKFSLDGPPVSNQADKFGLNVFATGYPKATAIKCPTNVTWTSITTTTANSGLTYDSAADQYSYVWKTNTSQFPSGSCAQLTMEFNDALAGPPASTASVLSTKFRFK